MGVQYYSSDDAGAPVLSGQAGALTALLDACLVNGYGSKPALGWEIAFTATDKRAYRLLSGSQAYLRVNDDAADGAQYADVRGYGAMTDVDTGTEPFPTAAQQSIWVALKSSAASALARAWRAYGDEQFLWLFVQADGTNWILALAFGDLLSFKPSDAYACISIAKPGRSISLYGSPHYFGDLAGSAPQAYVCRPADESVGSDALCALPYNLCNGYSSSGIYQMGGYYSPSGSTGPESYPSPVTGQASIAPLLAMERPATAVAGIRGYFPGIYQPLHRVQIAQDGLIDGGAALSGRQLAAQQWYATSSGLNSNYRTSAYIDITGAWR